MSVNDEDSVLVSMAGKDIELLRFIVSSGLIADEIFGFHAQQAVEKSLKAWIIGAGGTIDRTHDVRRLLIMLHDIGFDVICYRELIPLNSFAVRFRYEAIEEEDVPLDRVDILNKVESLHEYVKVFLTKA